jgi:hypothetical protein
MGIFGLFEDVVRIVTAPVEIIADTLEAVTEPVAEFAQDVVDTVKEEVR